MSQPVQTLTHVRRVSSFADATALVIEALQRELPDSAVWVGHLDRDRAALRVLAAGGESSFGLEAGMEAPLETSFCEVMASGEGSRLCNDTRADAVYGRLPVTGALDVGSFAGAPLELEDNGPVGTVCAFSHATAAYGERDLALLETFAALLARELDHERRQMDLEHLTGELRRQAATDPLTGIANRRTLQETLHREWKLAPAGTGATVVVADVDRFKEINDRFGHAAGDDALMAVGRAFTLAARPGDVVGRLGGDEFAAVLQDADGTCAGADFAAAVERHLTAMLQGRHAELRLSFGCSSLMDAASPDRALETADRAMYAHKRARQAARVPVLA